MNNYKYFFLTLIVYTMNAKNFEPSTPPTGQDVADMVVAQEAARRRAAEDVERTARETLEATRVYARATPQRVTTPPLTTLPIIDEITD